jgi:uncharacterized protein
LVLHYSFEWDPAKNLKNIQKHGVGFELSASVFLDPHALTVFDINHSESEERWISLGICQTGTLVVVHHTFEEINEMQIRIRIFSARKATQKEQQQYRSV